MSRYVLGRDTEMDLNEIWDYIAEDSMEAADLSSRVRAHGPKAAVRVDQRLLRSACRLLNHTTPAASGTHAHPSHGREGGTRFVRPTCHY